MRAPVGIHRKIKVVLVACALVATAVVGTSRAVAGAQDSGEQSAQPGLRIAILGDSYISGEGAYEYFDGTNDGGGGRLSGLGSYTIRDGNNCHQAPSSWAYTLGLELAKGNADDVKMFACSGADTANVGYGSSTPGVPQYTGEQGSQDARLRAENAIEPFDVVFVSLGGNDAKFSELIQACVAPGQPCRTDDWLPQISPAATKVQASLDRVRLLAPEATVYLIGYPNPLLPITNSCASANLLPFGSLSSGEQKWISEQWIPTLNDELERASVEAGAFFIDSESWLVGHGLCSSSPWNWGMRWGGEISGIIGSESYHPNKLGHIEIARLVRSELVATGRIYADHRSTPAQTVGPGYWMLEADGDLSDFGGVASFGDLILNDGVTAVAFDRSADGNGLWALDSAGRVHVRGTATNYGNVDAGNFGPMERVAAISATPSAKGYWVFTNLGRTLAFGDAQDFGDLPSLGITPVGGVVASSATSTGGGYLMLGSDGGVFAFGDAKFSGSIPGVLAPGSQLACPIVGLVPVPAGVGYWMVACDGGVFAFGDAGFMGSVPGVLASGQSLNAPVNGMVPYADGYLMVASDGGVFNFSSKEFLGSLAANPPDSPVIALAAHSG